MERNKYRAKQSHPEGAPPPESVAAVKNLQPQLANLRSNIGILGKAFNVRTQTGFRFSHIVLSLRQHLDRLRNDDDGTGEVDRTPGGRYKIPACLLRKFRSDQPSLTNRKKAIPKILVVDDNRLHLACAAYSLRKHFLPENVFVATNGREALEIMEHVVIDAILVDTDMPTMNGLEMADVVRHVEERMGQREFRTLIIAMLTHKEATNQDLLTECLVAGMDRFCVKPLSVHMHAILDAITVSGSAVEGFRRKALELQWVSRYPEMHDALFATSSATSATSTSTSATGGGGGGGSSGEDDRRRIQETALTTAPDLRDERLMLQLVEKDQRYTVEDIFARERRDDTERMQHSTALLRDRIEDLERQLAAATGQSKKTMESLHLQTIGKLEKQAEDQRLQIMKLSVRNRELTQRNEKLEEDMRQIIRHGANNARTVRAAFRFIGKVQSKMEKIENQMMGLEDRSANLTWQNYYGRHFQGTSSRKQLEMPRGSDDFSSSWYYEQMEESHRITSRSNEACASAVVLLGELLDQVHTIRPLATTATSRTRTTTTSSTTNSPTSTTTNTNNNSNSFPAPSSPLSVTSGDNEQQQEQQQNKNTTSTSASTSTGTTNTETTNTPVVENSSSPTVIGTTTNNTNNKEILPGLFQTIEKVVHTLSSLLMQNIKDLTEGTKRNIANYCVRELDLWRRIASADPSEKEDKFMDVPSGIQKEIWEILDRMKIVQNAKQFRSENTQTEMYEAPPWVHDTGVNPFNINYLNSNFNFISSSSSSNQQQRGSPTGSSEYETGSQKSSNYGGGGGTSHSFLTEVPGGGDGKSKKKYAEKEWSFTTLINKLRPILTFEGYVPLEVRMKAFEKIIDSVFRLERKQLGDLGEASKKLSREVRQTYSAVSGDGDEKKNVRLLGDVTSGKTNVLNFREIMKILGNLTDNLTGVYDAVVVHTLKSIEPSSGTSRTTKERSLAIALLECLESTDASGTTSSSENKLSCPWGEQAVHHKVRAGETWETLEKTFGCSLVEMKRLNDGHGIDFDENPPVSYLLKLPVRVEYIRSKFATLYHPKGTFSQAASGSRVAGGGSSKTKNVAFNLAQSARTTGGSPRGGFGSSFTERGASSMFLSASNAGGGRRSQMSRNASSMSTSVSRNASRMSRSNTNIKHGRKTPTVPIAPQLGKSRRRTSVVITETIDHLQDEVSKSTSTNRDRVNARVAAAALAQSKIRHMAKEQKQQKSGTAAAAATTSGEGSPGVFDFSSFSPSSSISLNAGDQASTLMRHPSHAGSYDITLVLPNGEASATTTTTPPADSKQQSQNEITSASTSQFVPAPFAGMGAGGVVRDSTTSPGTLSLLLPHQLDEDGNVSQFFASTNLQQQQQRAAGGADMQEESSMLVPSVSTTLAVSVRITETEGPKTIEEIAEDFGVTEEEIRDLNPQFEQTHGSNRPLQAGEEIFVPVKSEFVTTSLTEARDAQLSDAMIKYYEAQAAVKMARESEDIAQQRQIEYASLIAAKEMKKEASSLKREKHDDDDEILSSASSNAQTTASNISHTTENLTATEKQYLEAAEQSKIVAKQAAAIASESAVAADHATAIHRALQEHMEAVEITAKKKKEQQEQQQQHLTAGNLAQQQQNKSGLLTTFAGGSTLGGGGSFDDHRFNASTATQIPISEDTKESQQQQQQQQLQIPSTGVVGREDTTVFTAAAAVAEPTIIQIDEASAVSSSPSPLLQSKEQQQQETSFNERVTRLISEKPKNIMVDMPVKEQTTFEKLANLYGVLEKELEQANPTLSNPLSAGSFVKVPVNIEEWRKRVSDTAETAVNVSSFHSSVANASVSSPTDMGGFPEIEKIESMGDVGVNKEDEESITSGGQKDLSRGGSQATQIAEQQSEAVWSREEKALFASVKAALKQRDLSVIVEHNETEFGVTIETICMEYGCVDIAMVSPPIIPSSSSSTKTTKEKEKEHQEEGLIHLQQPTAEYSSSAFVSNVNEESEATAALASTVQQHQQQSNIPLQRTESFTSGIVGAAAEAVLKEVEKLNQGRGAIIRDDDDDNCANTRISLFIPVPLSSTIRRISDHVLDLQKRALELTQELYHADDDDIGSDDDLDNIDDVDVKKHHQKKNKNIDMTVAAAASTNTDVSASSLTRLNDSMAAASPFSLQDEDAIKIPNSPEHAQQQQQQEQQQEQNAVIKTSIAPFAGSGVLSSSGAVLGGGGSGGNLSSSMGSSQQQNKKDLPPLIEREISGDISSGGGGGGERRSKSSSKKSSKLSDGGKKGKRDHGQTLFEIGQLQELAYNNQIILLELLDIYFEKIGFKLHPPTNSMSTMTDNVTSILMKSLHSTAPLSMMSVGGTSRTGSRRTSFAGFVDSSSTVDMMTQPSSSPTTTAAAASEQQQRQLAAAAVLLGVDDIDQVPAALKNQKLQNVATQFLERMKSIYPQLVVSGGGVQTSAGSSRRGSLLQPLQQQTSQFQNNQMLSGSFLGQFSPSSQGAGGDQNLSLLGTAMNQQYPSLNVQGYQNQMFGATTTTIGSDLMVLGKKQKASPQQQQQQQQQQQGGAGKLHTGSMFSRQAKMQQQQFSENKNEDLLTQRIQRLGFRSSVAHTLYSSFSDLSRLHDSGAPLVENMLRASGGGNISPQRKGPVLASSGEDGGGGAQNQFYMNHDRNVHRSYGADPFSNKSRSPQHQQSIWGSSPTSTSRSAAVSGSVASHLTKKQQRSPHPPSYSQQQKYSPAPPPISETEASPQTDTEQKFTSENENENTTTTKISSTKPKFASPRAKILSTKQLQLNETTNDNDDDQDENESNKKKLKSSSPTTTTQTRSNVKNERNLYAGSMLNRYANRLLEIEADGPVYPKRSSPQKLQQHQRKQFELKLQQQNEEKTSSSSPSPRRNVFSGDDNSSNMNVEHQQQQQQQQKIVLNQPDDAFESAGRLMSTGRTTAKAEE